MKRWVLTLGLSALLHGLIAIPLLRKGEPNQPPPLDIELTSTLGGRPFGAAVGAAKPHPVGKEAVKLRREVVASSLSKRIGHERLPSPTTRRERESEPVPSAQVAVVAADKTPFTASSIARIAALASVSPRVERLAVGAGAASTSTATALATAKGQGTKAEPGLDLAPFLLRLRQSARHCLAHGFEESDAEARVRFCVDGNGRPSALSLLQSTGNPRLDRDAIDCVVPGAAPLPRTDRCLVVPLRFR